MSPSDSVSVTHEDRIAALERRLARLERSSAPDLESIHPATLYTLKEAAARLRCGLTSCYRLARCGKLRARPVGPGGKGYRVLGADLQAFLRHEDAHPR